MTIVTGKTVASENVKYAIFHLASLDALDVFNMLTFNDASV